jgi:hypothetical protein
MPVRQLALEHRHSPALAPGLVAWALLCLFCVQGTPPGVDLPAHAAQIQTLAGLLRGDRELTAVFVARPVPGYGLVTWLMAPVAMLLDGAVAARLALFLSIAGLLPALALLLNRARRPEHLCFFAAPFAFSFAYWYGFLPELFARTLAVLAAAAWIDFRRRGGPGREAWAAALVTLVSLAHVLTFGLLLLSLVALALAEPGRGRIRSLRALVPGGVIAIWSIVLLRAAVGPSSGGQGWRWDGPGHVLFLLRNYEQEGKIGLLASLVLFVLLLLPSASVPAHRGARAVVGALCLTYLIWPRDLGIAYVVCFRLPAFAGLVAVCAAEPVLRSRWRLGLATACVALALFQVVDFHRVFRSDVAGLVSVTGDERSRTFLSLSGPRLPGTRLPYLEHFGEWVTARRGGFGMGFFADAPSQPVQRRPGAPPPPEPAALYVHGAGPLPAGWERWCLAATAFQWRRFDHPCSRGP